jgi:hypothetical protein
MVGENAIVRFLVKAISSFTLGPSHPFNQKMIIYVIVVIFKTIDCITKNELREGLLLVFSVILTFLMLMILH